MRSRRSVNTQRNVSPEPSNTPTLTHTVGQRERVAGQEVTPP
jgi:hypothetical protein